MLLKLLGVGFVTTIMSLIIRQYKSDISLVISICGGLIVLYIILGELKTLFNGVLYIAGESNISSEILSAIIKIILASYLTEFCVDIAEDSGNKFIASKVLIGGKIAICVMAFPIIKTLFQTIISLI